MQEEDVLVVVLRALEEITFEPIHKIGLGDHLVYDLKIDSDDLSFVFIPELQSSLDVKVPTQEWSKVGTVQEVIELLKKYVREARSDSRNT